MADYAPIVRMMQSRHRIRVRRWRSSMSGCAWRERYRNGREVNWVEAPFPKTPLSLSIFLHEVGHHVIGFDRYRYRCEEEYHVWQWALDQMRQLEIEPGERVLDRFERSMQYAVSKALRRGIKQLPSSLHQFRQAQEAPALPAAA